MEQYNKLALDTPDLLAMLKQRGLVINNEQAALKTLSVISYFRLACYFRPMEADKQTHEFRQGTTLEQVLALYDFDTALRDMVFAATRQIEIALRTRINHHFSRVREWFSHSLCETFESEIDPSIMLSLVEQLPSVSIITALIHKIEIFFILLRLFAKLHFSAYIIRKTG